MTETTPSLQDAIEEKKQIRKDAFRRKVAKVISTTRNQNQKVK